MTSLKYHYSRHPELAVNFISLHKKCNFSKAQVIHVFTCIAIRNHLSVAVVVAAVLIVLIITLVSKGSKERIHGCIS